MARPGVQRPAVPGTGLEEEGRPTGADRFEVQVGAEAVGDLWRVEQRPRAQQANLLAVGQQHEQCVPSVGPGGENARRFHSDRRAECVVSGARPIRDRVVVRHQAERVGSLAGGYCDDVEHLGRKARDRMGDPRLLHPDRETATLELGDEIRARRGVGVGAEWPSADLLGQHRQVGARVRDRDLARRTASDGNDQGDGDERPGEGLRSHPESLPEEPGRLRSRRMTFSA